jgi:hypothetical protein
MNARAIKVRQLSCSKDSRVQAPGIPRRIRRAAVVASAVVPTLIANAFFLPRYLLRKAESTVEEPAS